MPEAAPPPGLLPELPEAGASGELRHIYSEIKRLSAVPMVALIYRHLATVPGVLEWAWALLEPALRAGAVQEAAWRLAGRARVARQPAIPAAALRAAGITAEDERAIAGVLDAYNRANPVNIVAVRCLSLHLAGQAQAAGTGEPWPHWQPPAPLPPLRAMLNPAAMAPPVRALAILLTDRGPTDSPSPLWPSLYRHLAHWPAFLACAADVIPPAFGSIDSAAARLRQQVDDAAATIAARLTPPARGAPGGAEARQLQAAIAQFSQRIPEMVVIGNLLRGALPPASP